MLRIALVDNHELVRIGLKTVLAHTEDIRVVADIGNHSEICQMVEMFNPELVLVDASEPSALYSLDRLQAKQPDVHIALMTTVFSLDCLLHTLCGNSSGYLLKSATPTELLAAVRALASGGVYIHRKLMECLPAHLLRTPTSTARLTADTPLLSEREQGILDLLARGYTNREVSQRLFLSHKTVEAYRARIYTKLGVRTRADLVSFAVEHGLVVFPAPALNTCDSGATSLLSKRVPA